MPKIATWGGGGGNLSPMRADRGRVAFGPAPGAFPARCARFVAALISCAGSNLDPACTRPPPVHTTARRLVRPHLQAVAAEFVAPMLTASFMNFTAASAGKCPLPTAEHEMVDFKQGAILAPLRSALNSLTGGDASGAPACDAQPGWSHRTSSHIRISPR